MSKGDYVGATLRQYGSILSRSEVVARNRISSLSSGLATIQKLHDGAKDDKESTADAQEELASLKKGLAEKLLLPPS